MNTEHKYKLYYLVDPTTREIRYVGVTSKSLKARLKGHMSKSKIYRRDRKGITYRSRWIEYLKRQGLTPEINLLQSFANEADCFAAERYWISYFRSVGCALTNSDDGGRGLFNPNEDTRQKIREGVLANPGHCNKRAIIDNHGNVYESAAEAARKLNLDPKNIRAVISGVKRQHKGYAFADYNGPETPIPSIRPKIKTGMRKIIDQFGNIFESVSEATKYYKFKSHKSISHVLCGTHKTAGGMTFRYVEEGI